MSDIMERLRGLADLFEAGDAPRHVVLHMRAGADEIARLRAGGCARDQGTTQYCAEAAKKDAEIASLLNLLADARTENMKLRAALRETLEVASRNETGDYIDRARAALEEGRT